MPRVPVPDTPDPIPLARPSRELSKDRVPSPPAALFAPAGTSVPPHALSQRDNRIIGIRIKTDTKDFQRSSAQQSPRGGGTSLPPASASPGRQIRRFCRQSRAHSCLHAKGSDHSSCFGAFRGRAGVPASPPRLHGAGEEPPVGAAGSGAPCKGRRSWVTPRGSSPNPSARWHPLPVGTSTQSKGRPPPALTLQGKAPPPAAPAGPRRLAAKPHGSAQLRHGAIFLAHNFSACCGQLPLSNIYCGFTCLGKAL